MRTRLSALAVAVSTLSVLTGCGGGSTGTFDNAQTKQPDPAPASAPTVTVTAPATATAGYAFTVTWSSTDATSCSADFTNKTDASGTASVKESAAASKTYTVTCTGAGGSQSGSATVAVGDAPTAEGTWDGTTDDNRNLLGVVLAPDSATATSKYFIGYSVSSTDPNGRSPAGFVVGTGKSTPNFNDSSAKSGVFASSDLREFNFAAGRVNAQGSLNAPYVKATSLGLTSATATFTDNDSITNPVYPILYTVTAHPESPATVANDPIYYIPATGSGTGTASLSSTGVLTMNVTGDLKLDATDLIGQVAHANPLVQQFQLQTTTDGAGTYHLLQTASADGASDSFFMTTSCTDTDSFAVCPQDPFSRLNQKVALYSGDALSAVFDSFGNPSYYSSQTVTWAGGNIKIKNAMSTVFEFVVDYTLTPVGATAYSRTFTSSYATSSVYDSPAVVANIAGTYTGLSIGIGATLYNAGTFTIGSDGAITLSEPVSHCVISSGSVTPHGSVNVFDVSVQFSSSGGTCVYAGKTFTGVAVYEAADHDISLLAVSAAGDQGFLVNGNK